MATERDASLDRLALGSDCPSCRAYVDTPCTTPAGRPTDPHMARIDRAVAQWQRRGIQFTGHPAPRLRPVD